MDGRSQPGVQDSHPNLKPPIEYKGHANCIVGKELPDQYRELELLEQS